jgi:hypothetical protein
MIDTLPLPNACLAEIFNAPLNQTRLSETGTAYWGSNWVEVRKLFTADQMRAYASAAVAAERERCAALCQSKSANGNFRADTRDECAALIRGEY